MKLYLIGLPGSGKSFLGKKLAEEAKIPFIDLDQIIEQEAGASVSKIFAEKGEDYFRNLEAVALRQQSKVPDFVMACGGGTPCFHDNMKFINETGKSIFLNIPVTEIVKRLNGMEKQVRPLLAETSTETLENKLEDLLKKRQSFYNQATLILTDIDSPSEILSRIKK
jgi:shikimate kinase